MTVPRVRGASETLGSIESTRRADACVAAR